MEAMNVLIDGPEGEQKLLCPVCRYEYSHIMGAYTLLGSDQFEARVYKGTMALAACNWRRSGLAVEIEGECGHVWRLVIQQHKGEHFIFCETNFHPQIPK